jgi:hypothetical protein
MTDPTKRMTAANVLEHPYMAGFSISEADSKMLVAEMKRRKSEIDEKRKEAAEKKRVCSPLYVFIIEYVSLFLHIINIYSLNFLRKLKKEKAAVAAAKGEKPPAFNTFTFEV